MAMVYEMVSVAGLPNYQRACLQLPSNLQFKEWQVLAHTEDDSKRIELLKYSFPMGYEAQYPPLQTTFMYLCCSIHRT